MATKTIAWEKGGGYITLTYTGTGNAPISVQSDANELYESREQRVQLVTTKGSPQKAVSMLVRQKGKTYPVGTIFNYEYTGSVQQVTLPPGKYKLQCWGAQGGNVSGDYSAQGSKGGYSEGELTLSKATTLYIFVGGKGTDSSTSSTNGTANGGWNGGGASVRRSNYASGDINGMSYPRPGGGGTDICMVTSTMSYTSGRTNRSRASLLSRFIVAGGGAGASARYTEEDGTENVLIESFSGTPSLISNGNYYKNWRVNGLEPGNTYTLLNYDPASNIVSTLIECYTSSGTFITSGQTVTIPQNAGLIYVSVQYSVQYDNVGVKLYQIVSATNTSFGTSDSSQQGGGTSGRGEYPGTRNSAGDGGDFGLGANQTSTNYRYAAGAGGGGWYGGGTSHSDTSTSYVNYSGGGSGFVNTAANASYRPGGYTGLQLDSGSTKDGATSFPSPSGGNETGHSGNGYARITVLEQET